MLFCGLVCLANVTNHLCAKSPTTSIPESYTSPTTTQSSRSTPIDKLLIMVTTDADQYLAVEVNSAKNAAVIRERIFTKVCLPSSVSPSCMFDNLAIAAHIRRRSSPLLHLSNENWEICPWRGIDRRAIVHSLLRSGR